MTYSHLGQNLKMITFLSSIGQSVLANLTKTGRGTLFLKQTLACTTSVLFHPQLIIKQLYSVGVLTILIITISGLFVGMVLGLQGYYILSDFGAEETLGVMIAASLVRELGPVVSALLFAGRAGSSLTAEIGLMKATEQLSGMEMMAVDPIQRIICPRFLAGCLSSPRINTSQLFAISYPTVAIVFLTKAT